MIRELEIRAEVIDGEVYVNRDDVIRALDKNVILTMSIMAVRFVSSFTHALRKALPELGGEDHEKQS
jgi:hypothetical protein